MDILDLCWRALGSRRATLALLAVIILALSCGAILPQRSPGQSLDPSEYAHWRAGIQARYLRWADPLIDLGLLSIRESLWFTIPLALLGVNLVLRTLDHLERARRRRSPTLRDLGESFAVVPRHLRFVLAAEQVATVEKLTELLEARKYKVTVREDGADHYLTAGRLPFAEWIAALANLASLVVVVAVILGPRWAHREPSIALAPGQEYQLQSAPSLSIRLDEFEADFYPNGEARSYEAQVTVLEDEREVASGRLSPGRPLWHDGMSLHQLSHGPLISIEAADSGGTALQMQTLAPLGTVLDEASLLLSAVRTDGYLSIPDRNLLLRLVFQPETADSPSLLVQAYRGGTSELVFSENLSGSGTLEIEGDSYTIEWAQYAVLGFASDPTIAPLIASGAVLLASMTLAIYLRPQHLWAALRSQNGVVEVRLLDPRVEHDKISTGEFLALATQIREALRGT